MTDTNIHIISLKNKKIKAKYINILAYSINYQIDSFSFIFYYKYRYFTNTLNIFIPPSRIYG